MHDDSPTAGPERLSRTLVLAGVLAAIGLLRLGGDLLTDIEPTWAEWLDGSPLRYLIVRVTDGSLIGDLNVQYFKFLAIPCGLSVVFLLNGGLTGGIQAAGCRWAAPRFRLSVVVALAAVCALCEIEKATHLLGLPTGLAIGERPWLNHVVHSVGGVAAYGLSCVLRYTRDSPPVPAAQRDAPESSNATEPSP